MAKHIVKCRICGRNFDLNSEEFIKVNANRYAHKSCMEALPQEEQDKIALENYIKQLLSMPSLTEKIKRQIKQYHEQYNYSYSGMRKGLVYFYEVRKNPIEKANSSIGILPYIYNEAFDYYRAIWEIQEENKRKISQGLKPAEVKKVYIQSPKREDIRKGFSFLEELDEE